MMQVSGGGAEVPMMMGGYPGGGGFGPPPGGGGFGPPPGGGGFGPPPGGGGFGPPPGGGGFGPPPGGGFGPPPGGGFGPPPGGGGFGPPPGGGGFGMPGGRVAYTGTGGALAMGMIVGVILPILVAYMILGGAVFAGQQMRGDAGQAISALGGLVGGVAILVLGLIGANKMIGFYWDNLTIEGKRCQYRGTVGGLVGAMIVPYILTALTLGIYTPWLFAKLKHFIYENVDVGGERLQFSGNPGDLLGLVVIYIVIVVVGAFLGGIPTILALPWIMNKFSEWEWNNSSISGRAFRYQSEFGDRLVNILVSGLLAGCTLYIGLPWSMVMQWDYEAKHIS
ncbi:MAG: DUF898 family protein [Myxococcales bacterium]|nr:DUF898 family protein [Myxococcales bacterium]